MIHSTIDAVPDGESAGMPARENEGVEKPGSPFPRALSRLRWLIDPAVLAVCYFIAGYIGLSLAVPPGYATVVWPASGVALAALLLRGPRVCAGVWIGSAAINILHSFDGVTSVREAILPLAIAATVGLGACLQALAGWAMFQRLPTRIEGRDWRHLLRLSVALILPCLISATIGVATLVMAGAVPVEIIGTNWSTWLLGDVLGTFFVLPILIFSGHSPITILWRGTALGGASALIAACLTTTLLLTFYATRHAAEQAYNQSNESFAALATDTEQALAYRLGTYSRAIEAAGAFAALSDHVTPDAWRDYVSRLQLDHSYPGMRGLGIFREVRADRMEMFRKQFADEFGDRFAVHPEVDSNVHFVIDRIEPLEDNLAALGLDLAFEQGRRDAIALSDATGEPTITRPIKLVQDSGEGVGFLLMRPIEEDDPQFGRRWSYSPLIAADFLADLTPRQGGDFSLEVFFGRSTEPDDLMYATGVDPSSPPGFELVRTIEMANEPITLRWRALPAFEERITSDEPLIVLASGIVVTILLGLLLIAFSRREALVVRKVEEATAEVAERNRMLNLAEATAHVGHWYVDLERGTVKWSDEVFRLHGLEGQSPPNLDRAIEYYHPEDRPFVEDAIAEAAASGTGFRFTARLMVAEGTFRHVEVIGHAGNEAEDDRSGGIGAVESGGDDVGAKSLFGVIIDRTEEVEMRRNLTDARDRARAADEAKTSFLANMSHEIRTPMNGVIGFTELALSEEEDPVQRRRLGMIADSGNAMLRLLNDLLDLAKIEANQMSVNGEPADMRHTMRSCLRLMEPVAKAKRIRLDLDIDPDLPPRVVVDKMRLRQIVLNLLGNAVKFTEEGEVALGLELIGSGDDRVMRITVRDTGIGIPADRLESVFEKFTQADATTARRFGGTGLGLPISAELARLMGGDLRVESELGEGSVFILDLPLRAAETPMNDGDEVKASDTAQTPPSERLRILVAEDNPVNQELTRAMVEKAGHGCELAENGREAIAMVRRARGQGAPFDLVLMDMQMPVLDGVGATMAIREAGFSPAELPIIAVTANAYADDIRQCRVAGMQGHLAKPLRMGDLSRVVAQWAASPGGDVTGSAPAKPTSAKPAPAKRGSASRDAAMSPRLRKMFADRLRATRDAIATAQAMSSIDEDTRGEIAGLLHQIAGTAAYFDAAELGSRCLETEKDLLACDDDAEMRAMLTRIDKLLVQESPEQEMEHE